MSWYRQYRPTTIAGLHARSVKEQLERLRVAQSFPHALLLVGPRGAGKTSTARIIAAMLNDPANTLGKTLKDADPKEDVIQRIHRGSSLAVHELDAASHRGIDDIRALKEQAYLPPQEGKVLVFILDEVHMLTTEAFNALLKLLEEPPSNVVFILATTEEHKMPETITSRCTIVRFRKASSEELADALEDIIKDQKLNIDPQALQAITASADGSFRDAVKHLETVAAGTEKITLEHVQSYLRGVPSQKVHQFIELVLAKQPKPIVEFFTQLRADGTDAQAFTKSLLQELHQDLVLSVTEAQPAKYQQKVSQFLLTQFATVDLNDNSPISFLQLELKALDIVFKAQERKASPSTPTPAPTSSGSGTTRSTSSSAPKLSAAEATPLIIPQVAEPEVIPAATTVTLTSVAPSQLDETSLSNPSDPGTAMKLIEVWPRFVQEVEQRNSSLAAVLRSARSSCTETGAIQVEVFYQFHRDQLKQPKFAQAIDQVVIEMIGETVQFEYKVANASRVTDSLSNVAVPNSDTEQLVELAQEVFL